MDRRNFLIGTGASTAAFAAGPAFAQEAFPSHAIAIINAFPPGGANDPSLVSTARLRSPLVAR